MVDIQALRLLGSVTSDPWSEEYWDECEQLIRASITWIDTALDLLDSGDPNERALAVDLLGVAGRIERGYADVLELDQVLLARTEERWRTVTQSAAHALGSYTWVHGARRGAVRRALAQLVDTYDDDDEIGVAARASLRRFETSVSAKTFTREGRPSSVSSEWFERLGLYRWQREAVAAWTANGYQGVVEAVTGAGKTRVALAAVADTVSRGGRAVVAVPTLALIDQWERELHRRLAGHLDLRLGRVGGGRHSSIRTKNILVTTMASAASRDIMSALPARAATTLFVADEVHRLGAPAWSTALDPRYESRLGLTATYEREDLGVESYLDPFFGGVCATTGYGEALRDGVIAPFRVALIGVRLTSAEWAEYEEQAARASNLRGRLIHGWDIPAQPFGEFLRAVHHLSASGVAEGSRLAGMYLSAFSKRRTVLAQASGKYERLRDLAPAVARADKTIVFTQTKEAAAVSSATFAQHGIAAAVLDSDMDLDARAQVFAGFEDGTHELVSAPRLLDEGIDVPAADLGIVLASSRSRRQMIQRMGRILRLKDDGRPARLAILFVEHTTEDPDDEGHQGFLDVVLPHAQAVQVFRSHEPAHGAVGFLCP